MLRTEGFENDPIAISIDFMKKENLYQDKINSLEFVVIGDKDGLSRVYETNGHQFKSYKKGRLIDMDGVEWKINPDHVSSPSGKSLNRIPAHNIFWFAWYNSYPGTRLVQ